jgi:hypothetical protein
MVLAQIPRCKGKLIKTGATKQFVINNCGEPDHVESFVLGARSGSTVGEQLIYYGNTKTYIVEIRRGKVSSIKTEKK